MRPSRVVGLVIAGFETSAGSQDVQIGKNSCATRKRRPKRNAHDGHEVLEVDLGRSYVSENA